MGALLACPFCRNLFSRDEAEVCPNCDLRLVDLARLPPSEEALAEAGLLEAGEPPIDQRLSLWFWGRGRGATLGLSSLGLWLFFQPWAHLQRPDDVLLSGFDIASGGALWLFGGAIAWFLLLPLLISRRSVRALIGARAIVVVAALMTVTEVLLLRLRPPAGNAWIAWDLSYAWGLDASFAVSLLTLLVGLRLGGSDKDFRDLPLSATAPKPAPHETIH